MQITIEQVDVARILLFRELYRQEMNCQIRHDSLHERGFNDSFLIQADGQVAGYGTLTSGKDYHRIFKRGIVNEFYLLPAYRALAMPTFQQFIETSEAIRMEAQTNSTLMLLLLYDFAERITTEAILFHDVITTNLTLPDATFHRATEPTKDGDWVVEVAGEVVASGGYLTHYNPPYADIYMSVTECHRGRGYGSYIVQELKRACYASGYRPAARCSPTNIASRRTLERAGLLPCARVLTGRLRNANRVSRISP
jgi:GNAT superfamily N-acetyltransferase